MPNSVAGGPGCCCCNDIHSRVGRIELIRMKDNKGLKLDETSFNGVSPYVDYKNERIYTCLGGALAGTGIRSAKITQDGYEDEKALVTFVLASSSFRTGAGGCAVDYVGEHVFYAATPINPVITPREGYLRRIKFDGTGDQTILTLAETDPSVAFSPGWANLAVSKNAPRYIFGFIGSSVLYPTGISRCNLDGTGHQYIHTVATGGNLGGAFGVDNVNNKLWFGERTATTGGFIRRCNFDGSAMEDIWTTPTGTGSTAFRCAGYSHITKRFYFWWLTPTTNLQGFYSVSIEGDLKAEVRPGNGNWSSLPGGGGTPIAFALGCGFQKYPLAT